MKTFIRILLIFCALVPNVAKAQNSNSGFDKEVSFDPPQNYPIGLSGFTCVYADSQQIYTLGSTQKDTSNFSITGRVPIIAAFDYNGQELWHKKLLFDSPYNNGQQNFIHLLARVSSNKLVAVNMARDCQTTTGGCKPESYLFLYSNNGDSLRMKNINELNSDALVIYVNSLAVDNEKNIILVGYGATQGTNSDISFILKYDSAGNFMWKKLIYDTAIGTTLLLYDRVISSSNGSGYLIAGVRDVTDSMQSGFYITKLDIAGNILWQRNLPKPTPFMRLTSSNDWIDVVPNRYGSGYYFMCSAHKNSEGGFGYYCGKLSEQGDTLWTKVYDIGGYNFGIIPYTLSQRTNGDLALSGDLLDYVNVNGNSQGGASILNLDTLGNVKWFKTYRYIQCVNYDVGFTYYKSYPTPYNGLAMVGINYSISGVLPGCFPIDGSIGRITLADSLGRRNPTDTNYINIPITVLPFNPPVLSIKTAKQTLPFQCYPNPAQTEFSLDWDAAAAPNLDLRISDVLGKEVYKEEVKNGTVKVNVQTWSQGLYSIRLYKGSQLVGTASLVKR